MKVKKSSIRLLIVGCGQYGQSILHFSNFLSFESVSVIKRDKENIDYAFYNRYISIYNSIKDAISDAKPNAVYIATPDYLHLDAVETIEQSCSKLSIKLPHLLIEKPIHNNIKELLKVFKRIGFEKIMNGVLTGRNIRSFVMTDWHKKFSPQQRYADYLINKNVFGKLQSIRIEYLDKIMVFSEMIKWAKHTDLFSFLACHFFDVVFNSFKNAFPVSLTTQVLYDEASRMREAHILTGIKLDDETIPMSIVISCNEPDRSHSITEQSLTYSFQKGRIKIDTTGRDIEIIKEDGVQYKNVHGRMYIPDVWEKDIAAEGYTYNSIFRWLRNVDMILSMEQSISEAYEKYPLSILPEYMIQLCCDSALKGNRIANYIMGEVVNGDIKDLNFIL